MTTFASPRPELSLRPPLIALAALVISFGLFVVMAKLVEVDDLYVAPPPAKNIGPVTLQLEEQETRHTSRIKPKPEPVKPPPSTVKETPDDSTVSVNDSYTMSGPVIEKISVGNDFGLNSGDQEVRPIVRVDPSYPANAARDGIEGWVSLRFTIDPLGRVRDIEIIDAKPRRIFDREARRALAKWKYQPRRVDGEAVSQTGMEVMLEFTLQD